MVHGWRLFTVGQVFRVRGSQTRRGTQSVRELIKVVRKGNEVGITPDGSRGPIYEAKSGATVLARITRAPVCLLAFEFSSHWKLKSWDRFVIPFPFSKVKVKTKIITLEKLFAEGCDEKATQIAKDEYWQLLPTIKFFLNNRFQS